MQQEGFFFNLNYLKLHFSGLFVILPSDTWPISLGILADYIH